MKLNEKELAIERYQKQEAKQNKHWQFSAKPKRQTAWSILTNPKKILESIVL